MRSILFSTLIIIFTMFAEISIAEENKNNDRFGGFARFYSLGSNPFIVDPDNIKYNFAYSSLYSNFIWGDIGFDTSSTKNIDQFLALNFRINKNLTIGALFNRYDYNIYELIRDTIHFPFSYFRPSISSILWLNSIIGVINFEFERRYTFLREYIIPNVKNNMTIFGTYSFENLILGLGLSYCSSSIEDKLGTNNNIIGEASQIGFNISGIGKVSENFGFDASLSLLFPTASLKYTLQSKTEFKEERSINNIILSTRGFIKLNDQFEFIPVLTIATSSRTTKEFDKLSNKDITESDSRNLIELRSGIKYQDENILIAFGPGLSLITNGERHIKFPEWNIGTEFNLTKWLITRIGYTHSKIHFNDDDFNSTDFIEGDLRLGLGLRINKFNLDAIIDDDIINQGFKLIQGKKNTFTYISMSYAF